MAAEEGFEQELDRIRKAYARRAEEGLSSRYSFLAPDHLMAQQDQEKALLRGLAEARLAAFGRLRVLDVGCGTGSLLLNFLRYGFAAENLHGIDLLEQSVACARGRLPSGVTLTVGSATELPYPDGCYDLVSQYTVFSSVLDEKTARQMAAEMWRVLAPGGSIIWVDLRRNNPWNPDVRGIPLKEVRGLFPEAACRARRILLAPPIARRVAPISAPLARLLGLLPLLRSHLFAMLRKPPPAEEGGR